MQVRFKVFWETKQSAKPFQLSLKVQQKLAFLPPWKYTKTLLCDYLSIQIKKLWSLKISLLSARSNLENLACATVFGSTKVNATIFVFFQKSVTLLTFISKRWISVWEYLSDAGSFINLSHVIKFNLKLFLDVWCLLRRYIMGPVQFS